MNRFEDTNGRRHGRTLTQRLNDLATIRDVTRLLEAGLALHVERHHRPFWVRWWRKLRNQTVHVDVEAALAPRQPKGAIDATGKVVPTTEEP